MSKTSKEPRLSLRGSLADFTYSIPDLIERTKFVMKVLEEAETGDLYHSEVRGKTLVVGLASERGKFPPDW